MKHVLALACLLASCRPSDAKQEAKPPAPRSTQEAPMTASALPVEWNLAREGQSLRLTYSIKNTSQKRFYICDKLVQGSRPNTFKSFDGLTVQNSQTPDALLFALGTTPPGVPSMWLLPVTYIALEPGQTHTGSRLVSLPLKPFNAHGLEKPLSPKADKAHFLVYAFEGEPPKWRDLPGDDGKPIRVPEGQSMSMLRGSPLPIPK